MVTTRTPLDLLNSYKNYFFLVIIALHACTPPPAGTSIQAVAARSQFNTGIATLQNLEKEYSALINQFTEVPVVNRILNEPPKQISLDIPRADLEPSFGLYTQNAAGGFDFTPGGDAVAVEYTNGINLVIQGITYHSDARLNGFDLIVSSNNRAIVTPAQQQVRISVKETRPDFSQYVPTLLNTGSSTNGTYTFTRAGETEPVRFQITRNQGTLEATGLSMQALRQLRFTQTSVTQQPFWETIETVIYLKSELPGVWWGFSATQTYTDPMMSMNIHMIASEQSLATTGLASFKPIVRVSNALYEGARVASLAGGPYTCDMNITGDVGTGTSIDLVWIDGTVDTIFPSLKFPCSRTVLQLPKLL